MRSYITINFRVYGVNIFCAQTFFILITIRLYLKFKHNSNARQRENIVEDINSPTKKNANSYSINLAIVYPYIHYLCLRIRKALRVAVFTLKIKSYDFQLHRICIIMQLLPINTIHNNFKVISNL
jgi:hypothetical protein